MINFAIFMLVILKIIFKILTFINFPQANFFSKKFNKNCEFIINIGKSYFDLPPIGSKNIFIELK